MSPGICFPAPRNGRKKSRKSLPTCEIFKQHKSVSDFYLLTAAVKRPLSPELRSCPGSWQPCGGHRAGGGSRPLAVPGLGHGAEGRTAGESGKRGIGGESWERESPPRSPGQSGFVLDPRPRQGCLLPSKTTLPFHVTKTPKATDDHSALNVH